MNDDDETFQTNKHVDTQQVLKDMFDQVTQEVQDGIDNNSVEVAGILDTKLNERISGVFKHYWNTELRGWVERRIQEEVADQATLLGKRLGELMGKRGEL